VHARSTTFQGNPANVGAGLRLVETEVWPMLERLPGCRGLSMLVDHRTGECIATTSWTTEKAMRESDEQLRPFRDRVRDVFGGSLQVDEWQVAVMRRSQHGESCRVSWLVGDPRAFTERFRAVTLPALERTRGFCCASLLVSLSTGVSCATTAWQTRDLMHESRPVSDDLRAEAAREAGGEVVRVHEYDLAYAHLHVPEMA
jgi:hypothetical protein